MGPERDPEVAVEVADEIPEHRARGVGVGARRLRVLAAIGGDHDELVADAAVERGGVLEHELERAVDSSGIHGLIEMIFDGAQVSVNNSIGETAASVESKFRPLSIRTKIDTGEDLGDRWNREGVMAHRGITVADVPNAFLLLGPNTGLGHNSVVFMIESQIRYAAHAIAAVDKAGAQALAPTRAAADAYNAELQRDLAGTVWSTGGCQSWYLDEHGVNRTLWSGMTWQYWLSTRKFKTSEYKFLGVGSRN